ncbi:hypothetical protein SKAU_G00362980 [Synaphobranchus kaupii]|uniref:Interleukin-1 n=1 Tax=Synaphobranchus kaupii TaxID=118154 RepID=A0A9Q1IH21_SYNKA|nr:hypothetical protein SKAU_G00362980 [Synaphobranchus kaupii]
MEFVACPDVVKGGAIGEDLRLEDALEVEVEVSQPPGMRQVANLIIALNRMKHSQTLRSSKFSDRELMNILMESVFEERVMLDVQDSTFNSGSTFRLSKRHVDMVHSVCNSEQRKLLLSPDNSKLHAVALQFMTLKDKEFNQRTVKLSLSAYMAFNIPANQGQPVALGIANTNLYMSCAINSGTPKLQLEEVNNKDKLEIINAHGEKERFLFFKSGSGFSSTTFESAKFKGWYISTEPNCDAPVEMCTKQTANRLTTFMVKQ